MSLKKAVQEAVTELVEFGLVARNMIFAMFLLKCNNGYDDKPQSGANNSVTVIFNDRDIPD